MMHSIKWALIAVFACLLQPCEAAPKMIYLTAGTTSWTPPDDFNLTTWTAECYGPAGSSSPGVANTSTGAAGGSGGYSKISNKVITKTALTIQVGAAGSVNTTFLKNASGTTILLCNAGTNASGITHGTGGSTAGAVGDTKVAGATGRSGTSSTVRGGPGGTSPGGPDGAAAIGGDVVATAGGGGAAPDGGTAGTSGTLNQGGVGGTITGGTICSGGTPTTAPTSPSGGDGGCGASTFASGLNGSPGSIYPLWDSTHGPGSGPGGAGPGGAGGACLGYGAAGPGGSVTAVISGAAGASCDGILVITYTPSYNYLSQQIMMQ